MAVNHFLLLFKLYWLDICCRRRLLLVNQRMFTLDTFIHIL
jgi:hypothetical protein